MLVSPPWRTPYASSLALGTLAPLLRDAGFDVDTLHGSTTYPYTDAEVAFLEVYSTYFFTPWLYPHVDRGRIVDQLCERFRNDMNLGGVMLPDAEATYARLNIDEAALRETAHQNFERAGVCVDRCVVRCLEGPYDVIGFTLTFDSQVPAAMTIARRLKAAQPRLRIVFGGAACAAEQASGLARSIGEIDAVCYTEGERVIVPLVRAMRGEVPLSEVPGVAWMERGRLRRSPPPALLQDLDVLPIPDYAPFIEQLAASEWAQQPAKLFFETSRGCWWGQKHLCTFCGLNAEGLTFRRKSPERALHEVQTLYETYPSVGYLQATDNILDMGYLRSVMPGLATLTSEPDRPLQMFFEVKSNLRRDQVRALADAGVTDIQPGIESFSDEILELMDKGSTGLGQVQHIKWAYEAGIHVVYNIIIRNPGERAEHYDAMSELVPSLLHLPPPTGVTPMMLQRFSPYHTHPERYGIRGMAPAAVYYDLFPDGDMDLANIAYKFDYEHPMQEDAELLAAQRRFVHRVLTWMDGFQPERAYYARLSEATAIVDERDGHEAQRVLSGSAERLFHYLDRVRPLAAIRRTAAVEELDPVVVDGLLDLWRALRWVCRDAKDRYLGVLPRKASASPSGSSALNNSA